MARYKVADNPYREIMHEGDECIEFETTGKYKLQVIVDRDLWYRYLSGHSWTGLKNGSRMEVKTSINKRSVKLWRIIVDHEYSELDRWGTIVDHINNDPLDNRKQNLRLFNAAILNSTNVRSKYAKADMQYIQLQGAAGYKVHYGIAGKVFYKHFSGNKYGSMEAALCAAKQYRDEVVIPAREKLIIEMQKKTRDIEFERGLRDKLRCEEMAEVVDILKKYGIQIVGG